MGLLSKVIYLTGGYQIGVPVWTYSKNYYNNYKIEEEEKLTNDTRIQKTYNAPFNKWAVITGGSEGIGKAYALDLAKCGFDIMITSQYHKNLESVKADILKINPRLKVKTVSVDPSKTTDYCAASEGDSELEEVMNNLGLLVNASELYQSSSHKYFNCNP